MKYRPFVPVALIVLVALSACNLPVAAVTPMVSSSTSTYVVIGVSLETEYRTGPGEEYGVAGTLKAGQVVEAVGRSPVGDYLLIRDPANPAVFGWLMSSSAAVSGDSMALPTFPAPATPTLITSLPVFGCPSPVPSGPTPISCSNNGGPAVVGGCPSPVPSGPTPISCSGPGGAPVVVGGCPSPVPSGPTPISCSGPGGAPSIGGCPSPVPSGPTPISCSGPGGAPAAVGGCPSPVPSGPTPFSCSGSGQSGDPPTPLPRRKPSGRPTLVGGPSPVPSRVP